jgi:solute carrier family 35 protein F5
LEAGDGGTTSTTEEKEDEEAKSGPPIMKVPQVAMLALQFLPIWFIANITYNWSLSGTSVTSSSIISTTSSFFTLLFCHIFKVERFTVTRTLALIITIGGVSIVAFSDTSVKAKDAAKDSLLGDSLAIISAVCYGIYASFLRIRIRDEKQVKMAMFFGFVGFFNLILLWPLFFLLHYTSIERFRLPTPKGVLVLTINGLFGTVLSDLLWSLVIFLTSATVATVGLSLNVPMSMLLDIFVKGRRFPGPYYVGAAVVLLGFLVANLSR